MENKLFHQIVIEGNENIDKFIKIYSKKELKIPGAEVVKFHLHDNVCTISFMTSEEWLEVFNEEYNGIKFTSLTV